MTITARPKQMLNQVAMKRSTSLQRMEETDTETGDYNWKSLYRVGGVAALVAGAIFRRNLGAEVFLVNHQAPPGTVVDWFALIQNNPLLGLTYLNFFDLVDS